MLDEKVFLPHPATEKNVASILPEPQSSAKEGASEGLAERDLLVLLQFLERTLDELLGNRGASTVRATPITPSVFLPQAQQVSSP